MYTTAAVDLQVPTNGFPLFFARSYESWHAVDGPIGFGWSSSLTSRLLYATYLVTAPNVFSNEAVVIMPDGEMYRYRQNTDGSFQPPSGRKDTLVRNGDGTYQLTLQRSRNFYQFDTDGALLKIQDEFGNIVRFTYDANRRLSRVSDESGTGRYVDVTWGPNGRISSVAGHSGRVVSYAYSPSGTLVGVTNPENQTTTLSYESRRVGPFLTQIKDHWGRVVAAITWDSQDRVATYSENGETYVESYDPASNRTTKMHSVGTATFIYNADGLVESGDGTVKKYDINGNLLSTVDSRANTTGYMYDGNGRLTRTTYGEGATAGFGLTTFHHVYDSNFPEKVSRIEPHLNFSDTAPGDGHWAASKFTYYTAGDPDGPAGALKQVDRFVYSHGTTTILPDGCSNSCPQELYRYDAKGRVKHRYGRGVGGTDYAYDDVNNRLTVTAPFNGPGRGVTVNQFDVLGRVASVTDPVNRVSSYTYDKLDRVLTVTLPRPTPASTLNFVTTYSYDNLGTTAGLTYTHVTDPNGRVTKQGYNAFGQLVESIDAAGNKTLNAYSGGLLQSITDANGNMTQYAYDGMRGQRLVTFPDGRTESYVNYADGMLYQKTDRKGVVTTYTYDAFNRLIGKSTPMLSIGYTYEGQKLMQTGSANNSIPALDLIVNTYDPATLLLLSEKQGPSGSTFRGQIDYTWDPQTQRMTRYKVTDGEFARAATTVDYVYFEDGSVQRMLWSLIPGPFTFEYDLTGAYQKITFPNGQTRNYTYDSQGRLTKLSNPSAIFDYEYDYNHETGGFTMLGQRTLRKSNVPALSPTIVSTRYSYDVNYQLIRAAQVDANGNVTSQNGWTYDTIGNRLTQTLNGASTHWYSYEKNGTNPQNGQRLSSVLTGGLSYSYAYDANGNTTTALTYTTHAWDHWDRMTSMTSSGTAYSFDYDAQGRRTKSSHMGTKFIYRGLDLVSMTYTSSGLYTWSDYLFAPGIDEPLARAVGPNDISYFSVDGLGSVVLLTDPDGNVKNKYDYKAWGESALTSVSGHQPFVYTGRELAVPQLLTNQLYYYRARYYSPDIGRFLSEDPARGFHPYAYVENNPLHFIDPSGAVSVSRNTSHRGMNYADSGRMCREPSARAMGCALLDISTRCRCKPACAGGGWRANVSIQSQITVYVATDCNVSQAAIRGQEQLHVNWFNFVVRDLEQAARLVETIRYPDEGSCRIGCSAFNGVFQVDRFFSGVAGFLTDFFLHPPRTCW